MKKAVAFLDGENFYHKLDEFGELRPWYLDWSKFMKKICPPENDLVRLYYYKSEKINSYDFSRQIPRRVTLLPTETAETRKERAHQWYNQRLADHHKQLADYETNIAQKYASIEIKKVGTLKIDPWNEDVLGEKGLDVGLAVDMLDFSSLADTEILISGDADYSPAVKWVKSKLKKVYLVRFYSGPPPRTKGTGADLLTYADETIDLYEEELWQDVQPIFKSRRR